MRRRTKGLRLAVAFAAAAAVGTVGDISRNLQGGASLGLLASGFALWASVSEARSTPLEGARDLLVLIGAAAVGAASFAALVPLLLPYGRAEPELLLVVGAFCVGYLRRFGLTGTGVGSLFYIGQLLAYSADLRPADIGTIAVAAVIAASTAILPRLLSGHREHPPVPSPLPTQAGVMRPELAMGLQAAVGALLVVSLNALFNLVESAWAITACTYVIAGSAAATVERVKRRIVGTLVGVPLGLLALPLVSALPAFGWALAILAVVIFAIALPERYDLATGAFAFILIITLAMAGQHSLLVLGARVWETLLGGLVGVLTATFVFPLNAPRAPPAV